MNTPPELFLGLDTEHHPAPPGVAAWRTHATLRFYLVNLGEHPLDVKYSTGGHMSGDDGLVIATGRTSRVSIAAGEALLVEETDESARDCTIWYSAVVGHGDDAWRGVFAIPGYGGTGWSSFDHDAGLPRKLAMVTADWTRCLVTRPDD